MRCNRSKEKFFGKLDVIDLIVILARIIVVLALVQMVWNSRKSLPSQLMSSKYRSRGTPGAATGAVLVPMTWSSPIEGTIQKHCVQRIGQPGNPGGQIPHCKNRSL